MAAYTLRNEASFLRPEYEHGRGRVRRSVRGLDPKRGAYLRREIEEADRERFTLRWSEADVGQRELLLNAWNTTRGVDAMNYTPLGDIDANALEVWFTGPPTITRTGVRSWAMAAEFEEDR